MNYCSNCGKPAEKGKPYCPSCGRLLPVYDPLVKKRKYTGYVVTFLLGITIASTVFYLYHSFSALPSKSLTNEEVADAPESPVQEEKGIREKIKLPPRERPGDRSYLPKDEPKTKLFQESKKKTEVQSPETSRGKRSYTSPHHGALNRPTQSDFSVFLTPEQANAILNKQLQGGMGDSPVDSEMIRDAKLQIQNNRLTLEAVINLDKIAVHTGSPEDRQKLNMVKKILPFVDTSRLPLEITGNFSVRNRMLTVDPEAEVKIGSFNFRLRTLHKLFLPGQSIPQRVPLQPVEGIQIENLSIRNGGIFISGKHVL